MGKGADMGLMKKTKKRLKKALGLELNYSPEADCPGKVFLGTEYGGWSICPEKIRPGGILYSLGVGEDISFDLAMIDKYEVQVYAFDPTPVSIEWIKRQNLPEQFHFFAYGIASFDGTAMFFARKDTEQGTYSMLERRKRKTAGIEMTFHRLSTIMHELGHQKIDILKMDIEGAEYEVIDDLLAAPIDIDQLLVEFHHKKFKNVGVYDTRRTIKKLQKNNFRIFSVSDRQREFSFIHR
jgi:FkbM family methyltransferase